MPFPECEERNFVEAIEKKAYYHEYEANICSRLGEKDGEKDSREFDLKKETLEDIKKEILYDILNNVIPVFDILDSRKSRILHRRV